jgi:inner membrane protein involved in colicin E2 resistance
MIARIAALAAILICTSIAWAILGGTIFSRTYNADPALKNKVESSWGSPQKQGPAEATYFYTVSNKTVTKEDGKSVEKIFESEAWAALPLESSRVDVALDLEHRQKGLLWYSTYKSVFSATYVFRNNTAESRPVIFTWHFPAEKAIYDDLSLTLDGQPLPFTSEKSSITATAPMAAGATAAVKVSYRSQGLDTWQYAFGGEVAQVRDFSLRMTTNFREIDFPENTLSPTEKHTAGHGWELTWRYKNLVSGYNIAMAMPAKLQPGPLAGQISFFAPVSLLFFFFVVFIIANLRRVDLHPMNYFFLATAFFAFHLLMAYLVDHVSIHVAFLICSIVSIGLVVSYLRLVVGIRFAAREAAIAQFIYLVLFSYAFFFKGFTGLAVTIGAILTLFVVMQVTGRLNWSQQFSKAAQPPPLSSVP